MLPTPERATKQLQQFQKKKKSLDNTQPQKRLSKDDACCKFQAVTCHPGNRMPIHSNYEHPLHLDFERRLVIVTFLLQCPFWHLKSWKETWDALRTLKMVRRVYQWAEEMRKKKILSITLFSHVSVSKLQAKNGKKVKQGHASFLGWTGFLSIKTRCIISLLVYMSELLLWHPVSDSTGILQIWFWKQTAGDPQDADAPRMRFAVNNEFKLIGLPVESPSGGYEEKKSLGEGASVGEGGTQKTRCTRGSDKLIVRPQEASFHFACKIHLASLDSISCSHSVCVLLITLRV